MLQTWARRRETNVRLGIRRRLGGTSTSLWLHGVLSAAAGLYLLGFVVAGVLRAAYPFPLETMENASVQMVRHIAQGQVVYGPPTLEFIPTLYTPLYFYIAAALAQVTGASLLPLRLVSLAASVVAAGLIFDLVRREARSRALALAAAGVFVGSTTVSLSVLDIARVDALAVCLVLAALYATRLADLRPTWTVRASVASGALAALAILTKQTEVIMAAALLAYAAASGWKRAPLFLAGLLPILLVGVALLAVQYGEWARFYLFDLARSHAIDDVHVATFWSTNLFPHFTLPLVLGPLLVVGRWLRGERRTALFYTLAGLSSLALAWLGWAGRGSSYNVAEPAFAVLSVLFSLGVAEGCVLLRDLAGGAGLVRNYLLAICIAQFAILGYNPRASVPLRSDGWASERLSETIAALPGTVFAPAYGEWTRRAGKGDQPDVVTVMEITGTFAGHDTDAGQAWEARLRQELAARHYDFVLWEPHSDAFVLKGLLEGGGYVDVGSLFAPNDVFNQWKTSTTPDVEVYVPRERAGPRP